jgi:hypothetical protein
MDICQNSPGPELIHTATAATSMDLLKLKGVSGIQCSCDLVQDQVWLLLPPQGQWILLQ